MKSMHRFLLTLSLLSLAGGNLLTAGVLTPEIDTRLRLRTIGEVRAAEMQDYILRRNGRPPLARADQDKALRRFQSAARSVFDLVNEFSPSLECRRVYEAGLKVHEQIFWTAKRAIESGNVSAKAKLQLMINQALAVEEYELAFEEFQLFGATAMAGPFACLRLHEWRALDRAIVDRQIAMHNLSFAVLGEIGLNNNADLLGQIAEAAPGEIYRNFGIQVGVAATSMLAIRWIYSVSKVAAGLISAGELTLFGATVYKAGQMQKILRDRNVADLDKTVLQATELARAKLTLLDYFALLERDINYRRQALFEYLLALQERLQPQIDLHGSVENALVAICDQLNENDQQLRDLGYDGELSPVEPCQ